MRHVVITLLFGTATALGAACFNPPDEAVQFSCDPAGAAECPAGYECRIDACCHREDTPEDDAVNACKLGGGAASGFKPPVTTDPTTGAGTTDTASTGGATDPTSDTGASTEAGTTSTSTGATAGTTGS